MGTAYHYRPPGETADLCYTRQMLMRFCKLPLKRAFIADVGMDAVVRLVEQAARAEIARRHSGYVANAIRCVAIYHWPDDRDAETEMVSASYLYTLIRAPLSA